MSLRQIYTVTATQVVVSENHPEGVLSNVWEVMPMQIRARP